jgi:hypothetical protein
MKDLMVSVEGEAGRVTDVPYLTRTLPTAGSSSSDATAAAATAAAGSVEGAGLQDRAAAAK